MGSAYKEGDIWFIGGQAYDDEEYQQLVKAAEARAERYAPYAALAAKYADWDDKDFIAETFDAIPDEALKWGTIRFGPAHMERVRTIMKKWRREEGEE